MLVGCCRGCRGWSINKGFQGVERPARPTGDGARGNAACNRPTYKQGEAAEATAATCASTCTTAANAPARHHNDALRQGVHSTKAWQAAHTLAVSCGCISGRLRSMTAQKLSALPTYCCLLAACTQQHRCCWSVRCPCHSHAAAGLCSVRVTPTLLPVRGPTAPSSRPCPRVHALGCSGVGGRWPRCICPPCVCSTHCFGGHA